MVGIMMLQCKRDCAVGFFALGEGFSDFKDRSHGSRVKACKDKQAAKFILIVLL